MQREVAQRMLKIGTYSIEEISSCATHAEDRDILDRGDQQDHRAECRPSERGICCLRGKVASDMAP